MEKSFSALVWDTPVHSHCAMFAFMGLYSTNKRSIAMILSISKLAVGKHLLLRIHEI